MLCCESWFGGVFFLFCGVFWGGLGVGFGGFCGRVCMVVGGGLINYGDPVIGTGARYG